MYNDWTIVLAAAAAAVALFVWLTVIPWLRRGPRGEVIMGLVWRILHVFCRVVHRARFEGLEDFRDQFESGSLIVVSNHTGAVDPVLLQAACRFHIRWMMASDMMIRSLSWLWRREKLIPVDRDGKDSMAAREAIRHVQSGRAIGIFPEGRIVRPPRQIRPFHAGVGLIVARTRAPVLLVWISGTPDTTSPSKSIFTRSRARVKFVELIDFSQTRDPHEITSRLRTRLAEVTGWPINDDAVPKSEDRA